jgi:hypothetical protein
MLRPQAAGRREDATWLDDLPIERLAAMLEAGREVLEWRHILAKTGDSVVGLVLRHEGPICVLDHCPKGDVFDPESHAQWYYHAGDKKDRPGEHGHCHTFLRGGGMPAGVEPAALPDFEPSACGSGRCRTRTSTRTRIAASRSPRSPRSTSKRRSGCWRSASRLEWRARSVTALRTAGAGRRNPPTDRSVVMRNRAGGDHEICYSPIAKRRFMVDFRIKSRHWANHTLKQAGLKAF